MVFSLGASMDWGLGTGTGWSFGAGMAWSLGASMGASAGIEKALGTQSFKAGSGSSVLRASSVLAEGPVF